MIGTRPLHWSYLGRVAYAEAVELQHSVRDALRRDEGPERLLLLEHPHVYTLGRNADESDVLAGPEWLRARGVEVAECNRGGQVTYHGPGQLVGYPIMHATDVVGYIRAMEAAIVDALAQEGVQARGRDHEGPQFTGVWVEDRKLASIGVHLSKGVSAHGFAVNVDNDVEPFHQVVACGLPGVRMTSLALETGRTGLLPGFRDRMAEAYARAHGRRARLVAPAELELELPVPSLA